MADPLAQRLAAIRAGYEDLPAAPWAAERLGEDGYHQRITNGEAILIAECFEGPPWPPTVAPFLAAARTDVPALVAAVQAVLKVAAEAEVAMVGYRIGAPPIPTAWALDPRAVRDALAAALVPAWTGPLDVTETESLTAVADLIEADHPAGGFWAVLAAWMRCVVIDEQYGEPETAPRIRERTTALHLAELYLAKHTPAKETDRD